MKQFIFLWLCKPTQYKLGLFISFCFWFLGTAFLKLHVLWLYKMFTWSHSQINQTRYIEKVSASVHVSSFSFPLVHHTHFFGCFFSFTNMSGISLYSNILYQCSPHFLLHVTVFHCMYIQLTYQFPLDG